jgi:glutamate formiminotransferase/formiminotetrahydrofolate cyclodeaminase
VAGRISYAEYALIDLLDAFASNEPVPAGGSASALAGALAVSLLIMVAGLPKTRTGAPEEAADLSEAAARLRPLRDRLVELVDQDSDAYRALLDAFKLPKGTDAERRERMDAVGRGMRAATDAPLEVMRACQQALAGAVIVARNGHVPAAADVGVAVELLAAAVRGCGMGVDVNLAGAEEGYRVRVGTERAQLEADATADASRARALLAAP